MQFHAITGCRPWEAAWVATNGKVSENKVKYDGFDFTHQVDMPLEEVKTKTNRDYYWLIERKHEYLVSALSSACKRFTADQLYSRVPYAFKVAVGEVTGLPPEAVKYSMRDTRCTVATVYMEMKAECLVRGVDPPPNPLQHVSDKVTREHYAARGADDRHKAKQRL